MRASWVEDFDHDFDLGDGRARLAAAAQPPDAEKVEDAAQAAVEDAVVGFAVHGASGRRHRHGRRRSLRAGRVPADSGASRRRRASCRKRSVRSAFRPQPESRVPSRRIISRSPLAKREANCFSLVSVRFSRWPGGDADPGAAGHKRIGQLAADRRDRSGRRRPWSRRCFPAPRRRPSARPRSGRPSGHGGCGATRPPAARRCDRPARRRCASVEPSSTTRTS